MLVKCFSPYLKKIETHGHTFVSQASPFPFRSANRFLYAGHIGTVPSLDNLNSESVNFNFTRKGLRDTLPVQLPQSHCCSPSPLLFRPVPYFSSVPVLYQMSPLISTNWDNAAIDFSVLSLSLVFCDSRRARSFNQGL